ncbi:hypothetical protein [Flavobacterium sp. TSSA_36]|uniref:hypothetical protein n=1 Tax=Flavobacterium sp. TSSA_36 TaxID=3447669 RepID=UPI003F3EDA7C
MRISSYIGLLLWSITSCFSQQIDKDIVALKQRMDSVTFFNAKLNLKVDISFINMPEKQATITYSKGKRIKIDADDFVLLPKRGLDFSLNSLTEYPYITVDRGKEVKNGKLCKVLNIIPIDPKADFSIATVWLDEKTKRLHTTEINTKKDGAYQMAMEYEKTKDVLPKKVAVSFEIEKLKIPVNFLGKGTTIDRKKMKVEATKKGKIYLNLLYSTIKKI